jgi:hypothetical protein
MSMSRPSSGSELPPRMAAAARSRSASRKPVATQFSSTNSPQTDSAASKAWPEEDDEGGNSTVFVRSRQRISSRTAGVALAASNSSARSRFSSRMSASVKGRALSRPRASP